MAKHHRDEEQRESDKPNHVVPTGELEDDITDLDRDRYKSHDLGAHRLSLDSQLEHVRSIVGIDWLDVPLLSHHLPLLPVLVPLPPPVLILTLTRTGA